MLRNEASARLGNQMRQLRQACRYGLRETAELSGRWGVKRLSNAELGHIPPTEEIIEFYEQTFYGRGSVRELERAYRAERRLRDPRRAGLATPVTTSPAAVGYPRDRSIFVQGVTAPADTIVTSNQRVTVDFELINGGEVTWEGRFLSRQDPVTGPHVADSEMSYAIPTTAPGERVRLSIALTAPFVREPTVFISVWKMTDELGRLFFGSTYSYGLVTQGIAIDQVQYDEVFGRPTHLDSYHLLEAAVEPSEAVNINGPFEAFWRVRNTGRSQWTDRLLERIGPPATAATMRSQPLWEVPNTAPGEECEIRIPMYAAELEGTSVSHWRMFTRDGAPCRVGPPLQCEVTSTRVHRRGT